MNSRKIIFIKYWLAETCGFGHDGLLSRWLWVRVSPDPPLLKIRRNKKTHRVTVGIVNCLEPHSLDPVLNLITTNTHWLRLVRFFWILRISVPFLNWRFSKPLAGWISYPIIFSWFRNGNPVSLHEGWRGFCILVIFFQSETSSGLVIL